MRQRQRVPPRLNGLFVNEGEKGKGLCEKQKKKEFKASPGRLLELHSVE